MKKSRRPEFWKPFFWALCGALVLWGIWGFVGVQLVAAYWAWVKSSYMQSVDMTALGQTGDLFGGINSLFAAFAFAGVALAAFYQHETWKLQAEETQMARTEHIQQSFEPLFFKLLERFELTNVQASKVFAQNFDWVVEESYRKYRSSGAENDPRGSQPRPEVLAAFLGVASDERVTLGPYFRSLFQIFKFISKSNLTPAQKILYANIVRSNLSEVDVTMLGFNCMTAQGQDFVPYVEAYGLLKHVKATDAREIFDAYYCPTTSMSSRRREEYWRKEGKTSKPHFLSGQQHIDD